MPILRTRYMLDSFGGSNNCFSVKVWERIKEIEDRRGFKASFFGRRVHLENKTNREAKKQWKQRKWAKNYPKR